MGREGFCLKRDCPTAFIGVPLNQVRLYTLNSLKLEKPPEWASKHQHRKAFKKKKKNPEKNPGRRRRRRNYIITATSG
jgi:hypothetical protein